MEGAAASAWEATRTSTPRGSPPETASVWLQVLEGQVAAAGHALASGDGLAVSGSDSLELRADADAELLLFDLA